MNPIESDSDAVVAETKLPYTVPVDMVVRTGQIALLVGAGYWFLSCVFSPKDAEFFDWAIATPIFLFAVLMQIRSSGLSIDADGIHHVAWFVKKSDIPWEAVDKVATGIQGIREAGLAELGKVSPANPAAAAYRMVLSRKDGKPPFCVNLKPYSVKGVSTLAHFILKRAGQAQVDEATKKLTKGIVPSLFFGEQKGHG